MTKSTKPVLNPDDLLSKNITKHRLEGFTEKALQVYGPYIVEQRAISDFRDGLKNVHRAILWSMYNLGLHSTAMFKKSARTVGDVIGSYHPHGDCLDADAEAVIRDGSHVKMVDLTQANKPVDTYSYDVTNRVIVPSQAHSFRVGQVSKRAVRITFVNGESITCTDNNPFYLYKWGLTYWEKAGRIKPGDMFLIATVKHQTTLVFDYELYSDQGIVRHVELITTNEAKPYYDFTVDKYHNMLVRVGENYVIAHNSSVYEALVGMVTSPLPIIDGQGDFGDQSSSAGAMRYTEARLSAFSDYMLLDKDYLAVTPMIPNYSGDKTVPVYLPAKLPMVLLLGNDGIAFGVAASSPSFTLESVVEITKKAISLAAKYDPHSPSNKKNALLSASLCARDLKFSFRYGGQCISDIKDISDFMRTGKGTLKFTPSAPKKISTSSQKRYVITSACPGFSTPATIDKTLQAIAAIKGVTLVSDTSDFSGCSYTVNLKSSLTQAETDAIFRAIDKLMVKSDSYDVGLTNRGVNATKFFTTNIPSLLLRWSLWRLSFEKKVIAYKYNRYLEQLKKLNLLILAVDNIDIIAQAIQSSDAKAYLMANLSITAEEADVIRDFKIRQLEKTDVHKVKAEIKDIRSTMTGLKADHADPSNRVKADIDSFMSKYNAQQAKQVNKAKKP